MEESNPANPENHVPIKKHQARLVCRSGRRWGSSKAGTTGPPAAISDFLTAMPEKRLPIIIIKAVLLCLLSVVFMGCDGGSGEESEETEGGWCNTQCATCDTEVGRTNQTPTVANTGAANYVATMTIDWNMCCCNPCWPFPWLDDKELTPKTTTINWDTGVVTSRPVGAARTAARNAAAAKLAAATAPPC